MIEEDPEAGVGPDDHLVEIGSGWGAFAVHAASRYGCRVTTTTISALRTAVIVAQALNNQKLVLDQITALNTTTSAMIQRTSEMLKENSAAIQEQAAASTIGIEQLQAAFANIYATMDSIDEFKLKALDNMSTTIGVLENEVQKSKAYLERVQQHDARNAAGTLDIG